MNERVFVRATQLSRESLRDEGLDFSVARLGFCGCGLKWDET